MEEGSQRGERGRGGRKEREEGTEGRIKGERERERAFTGVEPIMMTSFGWRDAFAN